MKAWQLVGALIVTGAAFEFAAWCLVAHRFLVASGEGREFWRRARWQWYRAFKLDVDDPLSKQAEPPEWWK